MALGESMHPAIGTVVVDVVDVVEVVVVDVVDVVEVVVVDVVDVVEVVDAEGRMVRRAGRKNVRLPMVIV